MRTLLFMPGGLELHIGVSCSPHAFVSANADPQSSVIHALHHPSLSS